jgi:hypothetical protein
MAEFYHWGHGLARWAMKKDGKLPKALDAW